MGALVAVTWRLCYALAETRNNPRHGAHAAAKAAAATLNEPRGCSSVVERHVANVAVVGSSPITRSDGRAREMTLRVASHARPSGFLAIDIVNHPERQTHSEIRYAHAGSCVRENGPPIVTRIRHARKHCRKPT